MKHGESWCCCALGTIAKVLWTCKETDSAWRKPLLGVKDQRGDEAGSCPPLMLPHPLKGLQPRAQFSPVSQPMGGEGRTSNGPLWCVVDLGGHAQCDQCEVSWERKLFCFRGLPHDDCLIFFHFLLKHVP